MFFPFDVLGIFFGAVQPYKIGRIIVAVGDTTSQGPDTGLPDFVLLSDSKKLPAR